MIYTFLCGKIWRQMYKICVFYFGRGDILKVKHKRGIRIPTRIIVSAILLLIQLLFLFNVLYDFAMQSVGAYVLSMLFE